MVQRAVFDRATYWIGSIVVVLILMYAYFVIGTIVEVVLREEFEIAIKEKHSSIATLEAEYLKAQQGVTLEYAESLGFHPIDQEEFLTKGGLSRAHVTSN